MYFHNSPNHIKRSAINAIACILLRNISNGEVSDNLETELETFWNQSRLDIPDSFLKYEIYDNLKIETGNFTSDLEKLLDDESCEYVIEMFEECSAEFIESQLN